MIVICKKMQIVCLPFVSSKDTISESWLPELELPSEDEDEDDVFFLDEQGRSKKGFDEVDAFGKANPVGGGIWDLDEDACGNGADCFLLLLPFVEDFFFGFSCSMFTKSLSQIQGLEI